jgi:hypothetical protein
MTKSFHKKSKNNLITKHFSNTISQMMDVLNLDNLREIDVSINKNIDDSSVRRIHSALLKSERPDKVRTTNISG